MTKKSFIMEFDRGLGGVVVHILDGESVYPLYWRDPEAGLYKIEKTRNGGVKMSR